jgi:hypothetical protein
MGMKGQGKPGFCKICAHPEAHRFILGAREGGKSGKGWNSSEAMEAGKAYGITFSRQTWYQHLEHAQTGEMRVIQAAQKVRESSALTISDIKKTSNLDVLEAIRDLGMARALQSPDEVTVDQALKAVQIMESRKDKGGDTLNILVQFTTGQPPPLVIEGEAREVPREETNE